MKKKHLLLEAEIQEPTRRYRLRALKPCRLDFHPKPKDSALMDVGLDSLSATTLVGRLVPKLHLLLLCISRRAGRMFRERGG